MRIIRGTRGQLLEMATVQRAEIKKLRSTLKGLHDWYVDYARINNLFNSDGSPGTFHELLQARELLDHIKPRGET